MNKDFLIWLIVAGLLVAGTGAGIYAMTRGIRNHNPGNIRHSSDQWQGMAAQQPDSEYVTFIEPKWGIRAMTRVLRNYQIRHGLKTVEQIISRWAPPTENITGAYVAHVAEALGVNPTEQIDVDDHIEPLVKTIILHENGTQPYADEIINEGILLA